MFRIHNQIPNKTFEFQATPERTFLKKDKVIFSKLQLVFVFVFIRKVAVKDNL